MTGTEFTCVIMSFLRFSRHLTFAILSFYFKKNKCQIIILGGSIDLCVSQYNLQMCEMCVGFLSCPKGQKRAGKTIFLLHQPSINESI